MKNSGEKIISFFLNSDEKRNSDERMLPQLIDNKQ